MWTAVLFADLRSQGVEALVNAAHVLAHQQPALNDYGILLPNLLIIDGIAAEHPAWPRGRLGKPSLSGAAAGLDTMDSDDEQLLRGRIYGADHEHPGPKPDGVTPNRRAGR